MLRQLTIESEVWKRAALQSEKNFEERTAWAPGLEKDLKERILWAGKLCEERTAQGSTLPLWKDNSAMSDIPREPYCPSAAKFLKQRSQQGA
jgi:hypothetical protein